MNFAVSVGTPHPVRGRLLTVRTRPAACIALANNSKEWFASLFWHKGAIKLCSATNIHKILHSQIRQGDLLDSVTMLDIGIG